MIRALAMAPTKLHLIRRKVRKELCRCAAQLCGELCEAPKQGAQGSQSQRISPEPEPRSSGFPALQGVGPRASESCRMPPGADSDFVKGAAWHGFRGRWSQRAVLAVNCSLSVHSSPLRPSGGNGRGMLLTSLLAGTPRYIGCPRCPVL